jgi:hypothetical protein
MERECKLAAFKINQWTTILEGKRTWRMNKKLELINYAWQEQFYAPIKLNSSEEQS